MAKKIAVLLVHGVVVDKFLIFKVGKIDKENRLGMIKILQEKFDAKAGAGASNDLIFEHIEYVDILQQNERRLLKDLEREDGYSMLKPFVLDFGGDAIAYQPVKDEPSIYKEIQERVKTGLQNLRTKTNDEEIPLVIISHSLGTVVITDYLYDAQTSNSTSRIEKGETLTNLYTMGSPLALWALRYGEWKKKHFTKPLTVPHPFIKNKLSIDTQGWSNIYNKKDVIGYPLQLLNEPYDHAVIDNEMSVGSWLSKWNALCHLDYWKDNKVTDKIVDDLITLRRKL